MRQKVMHTLHQYVLATLSVSSDFNDDGLARAKVLLEDSRRKILIEPEDMIAAARAGSAKEFDRRLATNLMYGLPFERGESAIHRAIEIAFITAIGAYRRHPDIQRNLTQSCLIESAHYEFVMLTRIEATDASVDEILRVAERSKVINQAEAAGITGIAIRTLAKRIATDVSDTAQALLELEGAAEIAVRVRAEEQQGFNLGDCVNEVLRRSTELTGGGDFDAADVEVEDALRREAEQRKAREIRLLTRGVDTALLRRDTVTAAQRIVRRTELELPDGENL